MRESGKAKRMRSNDNKKIIIIVIALLAVAVAVYAAVKLAGLNVDAREFYFKAESKNFNRYAEWINENYLKFMEKQKPFIEEANRRRFEVTADIQSGGEPFGLKDAGRLFDLIKRSKLVVDTRRQPQDRTALSEISLLIEKAPFFDVELFSKDRMLYFTVPVLMPERYFSVNLDEADDVYNKFSIPVKPKRLVNNANIAKTLQFDKKSLDEALKMLGGIFTEAIIEDSVRYGDEKEIAISGKTVKGKEVLISLDEVSVTKLLNALAAFFGTDGTLIPYSYGNFADIAALLKDAGLFDLFYYLDESGIVVLNDSEKALVRMLSANKDIEGFRKALKSRLEGCVIKDGVQMAVIIDREGNILDRKLSFNLSTSDGSKSYKVDINTGVTSTNYEDCRNRFVKAVIEETGNDGNDGNAIELQFTSAFEKKKNDDEDGSISVKWKIDPPDKDAYGADISLDITGETNTETLKRNDILKFNVTVYDESGDNKISGEVSKVSWKNKKLNTENNTTKISVQADLPAFGVEGLSAGINLACEDSFGIQQFEIPDLSMKKVTDLNAVSDKELDQLNVEVMASFGSFYMANKSVFDALLGQ